MTFEPKLDHERLNPLLDSLERARQKLNTLEVPEMLGRWLQRETEARGSHMSTRIEGNPMTEEEVRDAFARPGRGTDVAAIENLNYRDAVRFARQVADDASADVDGGLIRALHFTILREADRYGSAGRYRIEQNVVRDASGTVYMPPPPTDVSRLMGDLVAWLRASRAAQLHPAILAAVAHIELINIHPFDDGNGRTARALTAYFLARGGWRMRDFVSVEHVFGGDIQDYYGRLQRFGERYPGQQVDLTEWVTWFLAGWASEIGVQTIRAQVWLNSSDDASDFEKEGLPGRLADGVAFVALRASFTSSEYREALGVSAATAVTDLRVLTDREWVRREGRGRATRYVSLFRPLDDIAPDLRHDLRQQIFASVGLALE